MSLLDQAIRLRRRESGTMNPFRKESEPVAATNVSKARAFDLLVEMRARVHATKHDEFWVIRDLVVNGMTIQAKGEDQSLSAAISKCYIQYQEAIRMGAK